MIIPKLTSFETLNLLEHTSGSFCGFGLTPLKPGWIITVEIRIIVPIEDVIITGTISRILGSGRVPITTSAENLSLSTQRPPFRYTS